MHLQKQRRRERGVEESEQEMERKMETQEAGKEAFQQGIHNRQEEAWTWARSLALLRSEHRSAGPQQKKEASGRKIRQEKRGKVEAVLQQLRSEQGTWL